MNWFNLLIGFVVFVVILVGGFFLLGFGSDDSSLVNDFNDDSEFDSDVVVFRVYGENYKFIVDGTLNPDIVVSEGDLVRIEFVSSQGTHDWVIDEFDAATEIVSNGGSSSVEFVADEKGVFSYYCSVGQHRQLGMVGNFIVE